MDNVESIRRELKSCPLCGNSPTILTEGYTRILCRCGLTFTDGHRSMIKLTEKWNTRKPTL